MTVTCALRCPNVTYGDEKNNLCVTGSNGTFGDDGSGA